MVKRHFYFMDLLMVISSFAVVTLHCVPPLNKYYTDPHSVVNFIFQAVFSFGVPMFFMISGANILNYRDRYSTRIFWQKRLHKVIIPFLFWSLVGFIFFYFIDHSYSLTLQTFIIKFLNGGIVGPYWFFYNIIAFYVCAPFLSVLVNKLTQREFQYLLATVIIINTFRFSLGIFPSINSSMYSSIFPMIGNYLQYFLVGFYVMNYGIKIHTRNVLYICSTIALLVEIAVGLYVTLSKHILFKWIYDIANLPSFVVMCGIFVFLSSHEIEIEEKLRWINSIARLTFGVYLIHPFIIVLLLDKIINGLTFIINNPSLRDFISPIFIYAITLIVIYLLKKIPGVKFVIP